MGDSSIELRHGNLTISIKGDSGALDVRDLYTQAIIALIESADTHGWLKWDLERSGGVWSDVTPAHQFHAAILSAVARSYAIDNAPRVDDQEVHALLFEIIAELTALGRLRNIIRKDSWHEEDRPPDESDAD